MSARSDHSLEAHAVLQEIASSMDGWRDVQNMAYSATSVLDSDERCTMLLSTRAPASGSPASSQRAGQAIISLPLTLEWASTVRCAVDQAGSERIRRLREIRMRIGDAPHLASIPELADVPLSQFLARLPNLIDHRTVPGYRLPILLTPLRKLGRSTCDFVGLHDIASSNGCQTLLDMVNWTQLLRCLSRALLALHGRGWAHGHLRPAAVVVARAGPRWREAEVVDFAHVVPDFPGVSGSVRAPTTTAAGGALAPPSFTDLYNLGTIMLQVLLGRPSVQLPHDHHGRTSATVVAKPGAAQPLDHESATQSVIALAKRVIDGSAPHARAFQPCVEEMMKRATQLCFDCLLEIGGPGMRTVDSLNDLLGALEDMDAQLEVSAHQSGGLDTAVSHHRGARLAHESILALFDAAIDASLDRDALLGGLDPALVAQLPRATAPGSQIYSDLHALNRISALLDGSDPLQRWLLNAVALARPRVQASMFSEAIDKLLPSKPRGTP